MNLPDFCALEPWPKYKAYLQLKAALRQYGRCLFWEDQDIDLLPGIGRSLARQILYYFASGDADTTVHSVCSSVECIEPRHNYPIGQVVARKNCWEHIRQQSSRRGDCLIWCGGDVNSLPTYYTDGVKRSVAQHIYELHYGVKFFAKARFRPTCGVPNCIAPKHLQPLNPAFVQHWEGPTPEAFAHNLLDYIALIPTDKTTGCTYWPGSMNNGRTPMIKVGQSQRYSVTSLLFNYAYGPPSELERSTSMSCGCKNCVEPHHIVMRHTSWSDPKLEHPVEMSQCENQPEDTAVPVPAIH